MNITEIEQLSFEQLKADRPALTEAAGKVPVDVLASHFIRALTDATHRDEKLGEQGRTITALQDGMEASKQQDSARIERLGQRTAELAAVRDELESTQTAAAEQWRAFDEQVKTLKTRREQETERADRLKVVAARHHDAVASAAKLLNNALAAQAIDTADTGE